MQMLRQQHNGLVLGDLSLAGPPILESSHNHQMQEPRAMQNDINRHILLERLRASNISSVGK